MDRRLPPLNALRAFEAAGRHLSLTRAAEELHVTPAAVSHQVKALESFLGVSLFRRQNRSLLLTDAGQAALPLLREGFDRLLEAAEAARHNEETRALTVTVAPSFGAKWLVPRLDHLARAHPEVEVRIDASMRVVDLLREDVDVAIRYGAGEYPGMRVDRIIDESVFPVCAPRLLEGPDALRTPVDLCRHALLHVEDPGTLQSGAPDWRMWLQAAGVDGCDPRRGPSFSLQSMAVQAAIEGLGVALVGRTIVSDDIAAGRLVRPFDLSFPVRFAYWLVTPEHLVGQRRIEAFREWLLAEAASNP